MILVIILVVMVILLVVITKEVKDIGSSIAGGDLIGSAIGGIKDCVK